MEYGGPTEKALAPHSSTLAWKIPWTEEPGRLLSLGLLRVGQDWATSLSLVTFMHWRWKWPLIPVFLPGESQGQGSLVESMGSHRVRHDWSDLAAAAWWTQERGLREGGRKEEELDYSHGWEAGDLRETVKKHGRTLGGNLRPSPLITVDGVWLVSLREWWTSGLPSFTGSSDF